MSRAFTWWRRFYAPIKLPKQYYFKGLSPLLQRIEAGDFEFNHLHLDDGDRIVADGEAEIAGRRAGGDGGAVDRHRCALVVPLFVAKEKPLK